MVNFDHLYEDDEDVESGKCDSTRTGDLGNEWAADYYKSNRCCAALCAVFDTARSAAVQFYYLRDSAMQCAVCLWQKMSSLQLGGGVYCDHIAVKYSCLYWRLCNVHCTVHSIQGSLPTIWFHRELCTAPVLLHRGLLHCVHRRQTQLRQLWKPPQTDNHTIRAS